MAYPGYQPPSKTGQLKAAASKARTSKADIARDLDIARGRKEFFSNRPDVSDDRALRRMKQADELQRFKNLYTRPAGGSKTNLLQMRAGAPRSLADEEMRLAREYGPTFKEIGSDIGYAVGSMGKGLGQFIGKGGVFGSVLSDLYNRFKGGTQQGIETVKNLYDNLRTTLSGQPTVTYGGGSTMVTTSDGQPRVDLTPTSIDTATLPAMNLSRNVGDESDPSIFGITNTGVPLPNNTLGNIFLPTQGYDSRGYLPEGFSNVGVTPIVPEYSTPVPQGIQDLTPGFGAEYVLRSLLRDNTPPNQRFEGNYMLPRDHPVNVAGDIMLYPKDGGSVDKYAGLGYKLK